MKSEPYLSGDLRIPRSERADSCLGNATGGLVSSSFSNTPGFDQLIGPTNLLRPIFSRWGKEFPFVPRLTTERAIVPVPPEFSTRHREQLPVSETTPTARLSPEPRSPMIASPEAKTVATTRKRQAKAYIPPRTPLLLGEVGND